MKAGLSSRPVQVLVRQVGRTFPSPSASVGLARLGQRSVVRRVRLPHLFPEPEAEGEKKVSPLPVVYERGPTWTGTLNHLFRITRGYGCHYETDMQRTPPFKLTQVGSRPPAGHEAGSSRSRHVHRLARQQRFSSSGSTFLLQAAAAR
jgi:hypothetical protein